MVLKQFPATATFADADAKSAFINMRKRFDKYTLQTANAFAKKIAENPKQALVCTFSIQNVPESAIHIMLEAVGYLLYTKGHRLAHKITLTQTSQDTPDDIALEAENNRTFNASIRVHILTKEFIAIQSRIKPTPQVANGVQTPEGSEAGVVLGGDNGNREEALVGTPTEEQSGSTTPSA